MPLQKRLVPIAFSGGIDTKTDPKQVIPGKLLDLQNGIFLQTGGLNRRWGYRALGKGVIGSTATIGACKAVDAGFNQELLLFDGLKAYSYLPSNDAWATRGSVVSIVQTNQTIIRNSSQQLSPDYANLNGVDVFAWEDSRGGIRYSVFDSPSAALILGDQPLFAGMGAILRPKCVPCIAAGVMAIFFVDAFSNLSYMTISPSTPTQISGPFQAISGLSNPAVYDVATAPNGNIYVTSWSTTGLPPPSSAFVLTMAKLDVAAHVVTFTTSAGLSNVWLLVCAPTVPNGANSQLFDPNLNTLNGGLATITAAGNIQSMTGVVQGSTLQAYFEVLGANGNYIQSNTRTAAGVLGNPDVSCPVFRRSVGLASKAFAYLGNIYVNVAFQSQQQSTYFTLDGAGNVVSKVNATLGGGYIASSDSMLPECQNVSPGQFEYANLEKGIVNTEAGGVLSLLGVNTTNLDFLHSNNFLSSAINGCLYTVGGILQSYDGQQYVEHGFHVYPEAIVATPSAVGGAMGAGIYNYAVTYEWPDNNGNTQISTPSIVYSVTVPGTALGSVQHTIPTLRLTKKSRVKIVVYRTQGTTNGTLLFRVTSAAVPLYNDPTVDTVTFTDTLADASIGSNGLMYTQPLVSGTNPVLPNSAPPSCSLIATFANRVVLAGLDDSFSLAYTKAAVSGIPMEFASILTLRCDPDGGPITAIARMDDKLVIFKKTSIFYITGQGPTATGDQNDFGTPISIPSGDVGCVSQNSIVSTPVGLLFQSLNGIYLLDRGLNVSYKGAPVEAFNALPITSATLVPNQWVIFTTNTDKAIVYDYYYDQWSTFTNHSATDSDTYLGSNNALVIANPNGTIYLQTPSTFTDNGVPIKFRALTAKINPGVLQGYQRVYHAFLLGQYKGSHTLSVQCLFDYDDTFTAMTLIPADATLGTGVTFGTPSPFGIDSPFGGASSGQQVYQFRLDILRKCQSVQFDITDLQTNPGNEGFSLSALSLLVGVKQGGMKVPAIKQFGVT
jgi:hypothetical protein